MITGHLVNGVVEVEDLSGDKLSRAVWRFALGGRRYDLVACAHRLLLESYDRQSRASTRHKWVCGAHGEALYLRQRPDWQVRRSSNSYLRGQDVPLPEKVQAEAIATAAAALKIEVAPTREGAD